MRVQRFAFPIVLLLAAAACGGSDDPPSSSSADDAVEEAPATPEQLRIGAAAITPGMGLVTPVKALADHQEVFDVEAIGMGGSNANVIAALLSGDIDVGAVAVSGSLDALLEGADLKAVAGSFLLSAEMVLNADVAERIERDTGVGPDSPIEDRAKALAGLTLSGAPAPSVNYTALSVMLGEGGLTTKDVTFASAGETAVQVEGIRHGQYDGGVKAGGALLTLVNDGAGVLWMRTSETTAAAGALSAWILTTSDKAEDDEWVGRVQDLFASTYTQIKEDPRGSMALTHDLEELTQIEDSVFELIWDEMVAGLPEGALITEDSWQKAIALAESESESGASYDDLEYEEIVVPQARA